LRHNNLTATPMGPAMKSMINLVRKYLRIRAARRLAALGGSTPQMQSIPRRRPS